jgi:hypothetical protein
MRRMSLLVLGAFLLTLACGTESEDLCLAICDGSKCGMTGECDCGQCGVGNICMEGACVDEVSWNYQKTCTGGKCGTVEDCDCGDCPTGQVCDSKQTCVEDPCFATCNEHECGKVDGCQCGVCEGDAVCSGEGVCETPDPCVDLCAGKECGAVGDCECGACSEVQDCVAGNCQCVPSCGKKKCGSNGCGGSCGECAGKLKCGSDGTCHDIICLEGIKFAEGQKLDTMAIGEGGHPGEALDVDGDPDTCAPVDDCELGLNNQLSGLLEQLASFVDANGELATALEEGKLVLLAEIVDYEGEGIPFTLNMYLGDPVAPKEECNYQAEVCDYLVDTGSFDVLDCEPIITFNNALVMDGNLTAGGPDSLFSLSIPVTEDLILTVTANMAQIQGTFVTGDLPTISDGLVGGAIRKDKLMESLQAMPDEMFDDLPISKDMLLGIIPMVVQNDVDTDLDGELDAASIGIKFSTIGANLAGIGDGE